MEEQIITKEGYNKLKEELDFLTNTKRREIAGRIEKAKDLGDLSENAEYQEAKDAQAFNEGRIAELTLILKKIKIVENGNSNDFVSMGSRINVKANGNEREFTIVSFNEADPSEGKISNESPLGHSFLGKKKGDKVTVKTPKGNIEYEIIKIS